MKNIERMAVCQSVASSVSWAREEFGTADFGDHRLTTRIESIGASLAEYPAGKVTDVFHSSADLEAAYRFVRNERVTTTAITAAMCEATLHRCVGEPFVYVALDGSSLTLTDDARLKNFGVVGAHSKGARGLNVTAALVVTPAGVTMGLSSLQMWTRGEKLKVSHKKRKFTEKELWHWGEAIDETISRFAEVQDAPKAWFQLDREGDAGPLLQKLAASPHYFTARVNHNRRIKSCTGKRRYVLDELARRKARKGTYSLYVPPGDKRTERIAEMSVYATKINLLLRTTPTGQRFTELPIHAIRVRESSPVPKGEKPIEWILFTNYPIDSLDDISLVIHGYCLRWRIEEFFRTWKTTGCDVESTQLHSTERVRIWATMLAAVSTRIERMKQLARTRPDAPATIEFSELELDVLIALKQKWKKKTETIPNVTPRMEDAVRWVAELGGYTGNSSGGPPGSVTIRRGLERLESAVEGVKCMRSCGKM